MSVTYITIQLRRPRDGDPGEVAEAWFVVDGHTVQFTDRDGHPLPGDENRSPLKDNETPRECAVRLLRRKTGTRISRPFNRKIIYPKFGMA